jgi:glycosyltransferase involved in cell wall biosynthesis
MHRWALDAVDRLKSDARVSFWGHVGLGVADAVARMRHPDRVCLGGHALDPAAAMSGAGIFLYPLRSDHYGTAENALVEAMSLGLVPVVLDNPAELEIVRHGVTGLVARSAFGLAAHVNFLASSPTARKILSENAVRETGRSKYSPAASAVALAETWRRLLVEPARRVVGERVIIEGSCSNYPT